MDLAITADRSLPLEGFNQRVACRLASRGDALSEAEFSQQLNDILTEKSAKLDDISAKFEEAEDSMSECGSDVDDYLETVEITRGVVMRPRFPILRSAVTRINKLYTAECELLTELHRCFLRSALNVADPLVSDEPADREANDIRIRRLINQYQAIRTHVNQ